MKLFRHIVPSIVSKIVEKVFNNMHQSGMTLTAKGIILAFVVFTALDVKFANSIYSSVREWIESTLNWYYIGIFALMLFVCLYLMFSRFGRIRLGSDDSRPEFSYFSWFAMLFSAGVGIGILFFGIAEPLFYFDNTQTWGYPNNPFADQAQSYDMDYQRAIFAMQVTYFHWGFHGWALYVIFGLCLAYFGYRKKLPLTMGSALYPIIGDRIYGPIGRIVDLLAVFGTVFGVATSLGLGVSQMASGLNYLFGVSSGLPLQITLIIIISTIATLSTASGVKRGIRMISEWNIYLSLFLLAYFLFGGPFVWLMEFFIRTTGAYLRHAIPMSFQVFNDSGNGNWQSNWTIFYWGWWISWAPFVGMFIARISRGRTIREFMLGVMLVPTLVAFFCICIFGGTALHMEMNAVGGVGTAGIMQLVRDWDLPFALYSTIGQITNIDWLNWAAAGLATFLIGTWFITSSDSGTLVITTILNEGEDHPPVQSCIIWGLGEGLVAILLLITGGLQALQTASIVAALPISVVIILMTVGILKSLHSEE